MASIQELEKQLEEIKERNRRVEFDKAWETSWTRRLLVLVFTYLVIVVLFLVVELPNPFVNALVPSVAFVLSTLTVPFVKDWWLRRLRK
ncbi:hypothetical protein CO046_03275 [Candidatus Peregrinibacteria bacterium CG_4_9_14_0_2_um_filter_53_11]|nr:MAG: hypothetical protein CO046_03275 [Candidatus Peregrinibacteria bacterium CG_4_9_14_0_2_um_filter_53_11]